jgi:AcrR family transcriptional regulator
MAERWTKERRLEHTRSLLLDSAEDVFARKGFEGAALEDIADAAGYTRGAIYSHFGSKVELFFAVLERQRMQFLDGFSDVIAAFNQLDQLDIDEFAARWGDLIRTGGADRAALGFEFTLFLVRNPDARDRVAAQREETVRSLAEYISSGADRLGARLTTPSRELAQVILAAYDGVTLSSLLDDTAVYRTFLEMVISHIVPAHETK